MMIQRFFLIIQLIILIILSGCKAIDDPSTLTNPDEQQVTLRLLMPQQQTKAGTYAVSEVDQNSIYTLDVLAFRLTDDGKEIFAYSKKGVLLRPNPGATEVNFHVDLLKSTDNYRFILLANASTQLQSALNGLPVNAEKETLMNRIEYRISSKWNASSSVSFTPFPMWGESGIIPGISNTTSGFSVSMLRSLAAIDVNVTASDFVMTQVSVYNQQNKGRIAPLPANYDAGSSTVTAPSILAGTTSLGPQQYPSGAKTLAGEIFLFENTAPANTGQNTATGMVIAGKYAGSNTNTFYRVELTDNQGNLLPVLRNHRYVIDITKVHAPGFSSEAEAWASKPVGMTATVTPWNQINVSEGNIPVNYLRVSTTKANVIGVPGDMTFSVWTNLPDVTLDLPAWLKILESDKIGDKTIYKLEVNANPSATAPRSGKINVKVGRLIRGIDIAQSARPIDLGDQFNFYVFANDILYFYYWYVAANVQEGNYSMLDASLTQKLGDPYPKSCIATLGSGARLPTIQELRQLIPLDAAGRAAINQALHAQGGESLGTTVTYYPSSSSATEITAQAISWEGTSMTYNKFPNQGNGNLRARCVISK
ncbi:hypothetical protein ACR79S_02220 [Sphingobacterium spiritivorum]|uniref:hypothetical protein n=1 Tax=Sphingobacterium spiritivorum TaxID=258 RepID=UPI003DA1F184